MTRMTGFSPMIRSIIYDRSGGRCERCGGSTSDVQIHHRRPRGMGGTRRADTNYPPAGCLLCSMCHNVVESHRAQAFDDGFLVRQSHNPSQVPVWYRKYSSLDVDRHVAGKEWRLADDGSVVPWAGEAA